MKPVALLAWLFFAMIVAGFRLPEKPVPEGELAAAPALDSMRARPTVEAVRVTNPIRVDGVLSEAEWRRPGQTDFTQHDPIEGTAPTQKTEVWVAYDDEALYVGARMYDTHPDSIVSRMGRRDAGISSDMFYVGIDSYHDRRTGFYFGVYASGAVTDGTLSNDSWDDNSWDGIWEAATVIDEKGWSAEMKIPYSQLRFPKKDEYVWGITFFRSIERNKERDDFVFVPKKESGWVSHFADLKGLKNINPPAKIELRPYAVAKEHLTNQFSSGDPFHGSSASSGSVGGDLKYGLGSNLTLNATINPDFGQVEVDPAVVNLTQFETFFQEKRPFFIEGSGFFDFGYGGSNNNWGFNWGNPEYFYSRRIGRPPQGSAQHDGFADYPDVTRILGAAKITGKAGDAVSVASMHAVTAREYARVADSSGRRYSDLVEPLTSYNAFRTLREFNDGKQAVGLIGTAVLRDLNQPYVVDDYNRQAFAAGVDGWTNLDPAGEYVATGWFSASTVRGTAARILSLQEGPLHYYQRPDATEVTLDPARTSLNGFAGRVAVNKQKGNFSFNSAVGLISPGFDSNDLGFLFRTDVINGHIVVGYTWFDPDGFFRSKSFNLATFRNYTFAGDKANEGYFFFWNARLMNYWDFNGSVSYNLEGIDTRISRGGPKVLSPNQVNLNFYGESDGRQWLVAGAGIFAGKNDIGGTTIDLFPSLQVKASSGLTLSLSPEFVRTHTAMQWVTSQADPAASATFGTRYLFALLDQNELSSSIRMDWTFTPRLSLQLYMQPLLSVGRYSGYKELSRPGTHDFLVYGEGGSTLEVLGDSLAVDPDGPAGPAGEFRFARPDFNEKFLKINAVLRWEYSPGSTAYFVWTRGSSSADHPGDFSLQRDMRDLVAAPDHDDVFVVKISYAWQP